MDTRRVLTTAGVSGTALVLAAFGGATWYYAHRITEPPSDAPPPTEPADRVRVVGYEGEHIVLVGVEAHRPAVWGLVYDGGYGQVGEVVSVSDRDDDGAVRAVRTFRAFGDPPPAGTSAMLDRVAYPDDPSVLGLPFEHVSFTSDVGENPAYLFPADSQDWVVFVHGRQSRRHEPFRLIPTVHRLGLNALTIAYRNDGDAPRSPDGRSHLGATEWKDVAAALEMARGRGAQRFVLMGYSMGGACVMNLLRRSDGTDDVAGSILEAPVLDWVPVIRSAAKERGVPDALLPLLLPSSLALASVMAGVEWQEVNHLDDPSTFTSPKLLIHGIDDPIVPVSLADALATARPDIVTYLRVPGGKHGTSYNVAPHRYEAALEEFLTRVLP